MHLTYPNEHRISEPPKSKDSAGAPVAEIEVMPEMIEAGAMVLLRDDGLSSVISPTIAEIIAEGVLRAALTLGNNGGIRLT